MTQPFHSIPKISMIDQSRGISIKRALGIYPLFIPDNHQEKDKMYKDYSESAVKSLINVSKLEELKIARSIGRQAIEDRSHRTNAMIDNQTLRLLDIMKCSPVGIFAIWCLINGDYSLVHQSSNSNEEKDVVRVRLRPGETPFLPNRLDLSIRFEIQGVHMWWEGNLLRFEKEEDVQKIFNSGNPKMNEYITKQLDEEDQHYFVNNLMVRRKLAPGVYEVKGAKLEKVIPFF